jgi:hypothetical protein
VGEGTGREKRKHQGPTQDHTAHGFGKGKKQNRGRIGMAGWIPGNWRVSAKRGAGANETNPLSSPARLVGGFVRFSAAAGAFPLPDGSTWPSPNLRQPTAQRYRANTCGAWPTVRINSCYPCFGPLHAGLGNKAGAMTKSLRAYTSFPTKFNISNFGLFIV